MRAALFVFMSAAIACASLGACESTSLEGLSGGETAQALVRCPIDPCTKDAPECCAEGPDGSVYLRSSCREAGACSRPALLVRCRESSDCERAGAPPDNVCCVFRNGNATSSVECVAPSACIGRNRIACNAQQPKCAEGETCGGDPSAYWKEIDVCYRPD